MTIVYNHNGAYTVVRRTTETEQLQGATDCVITIESGTVNGGRWQGNYALHVAKALVSVLQSEIDAIEKEGGA